MELNITNELSLIITLATFAVVVIAGLWAIARVQKKNETLTFVLMILVLLAVSMLTGQILLLLLWR